MSRIGKQPIEVPEGVTVSVGPGRVTVNGPKGELNQGVSRRMEVVEEDGTLTV
jgi:large subunit ribosomal protein L6